MDGVEYETFSKIPDSGHAVMGCSRESASARALQDLACSRHPDGVVRVRITVSRQDLAARHGGKAVANIVEACCPEMQIRAEQAIAS